MLVATMDFAANACRKTVPVSCNLPVNTIMRDLKTLPVTFPEPWATDWGEDEYGLWMAFTFKDVRQAFRWIEPGTLSMGSHRDEPERWDDETQHEVTLSQGFWLADTVVTQALWQAVMEENPSGFKGESRPVENVSWEDAQRFIEAINAMKPELKLCLPTEAQWEYACRAETTTPFSFGNNITTEQVNYDGNAPYLTGKKGLYIEETVDVKSLPCNDWGLYEMHGNVWEWCQDWYGEYDTAQASDPVGPESGDDRVLRGGSWINDGRDVRSAYRFHNSPDYRNAFIGFRLSRGY